MEMWGWPGAVVTAVLGMFFAYFLFLARFSSGNALRTHIYRKYGLDMICGEEDIEEERHVYDIQGPHPLSALEVQLRESEARFPIYEGLEKCIVWHSSVLKEGKARIKTAEEGEGKRDRIFPYRKTEYSIVFVHGWTASHRENSPLPEHIAEAIGANLYFARLSGHAYDSERDVEGLGLLNDCSPALLFSDAVEAIRIGQQIGERVILMGCSTGAALVTWIACQKEFQQSIAALVVVSPAYGINSPIYPVLKYVFAYLSMLGSVGATLQSAMLRVMFGTVRSSKPYNERHELFWTHNYPVRALSHVFDTIFIANQLDMSVIECPFFVAGSPRDRTVSWEFVKHKFATVASKDKELHDLEHADHDHVVVGDILAPSTFQQTEADVLSFLNRALDLGLPVITDQTEESRVTGQGGPQH